MLGGVDCAGKHWQEIRVRVNGASHILAEAAWAILREALLTEIGSAPWFMVIGANRYPTEQSMVWT